MIYLTRQLGSKDDSGEAWQGGAHKKSLMIFATVPRGRKKEKRKMILMRASYRRVSFQRLLLPAIKKLYWQADRVFHKTLYNQEGIKKHLINLNDLELAIFRNVGSLNSRSQQFSSISGKLSPQHSVADTFFSLSVAHRRIHVRKCNLSSNTSITLMILDCYPSVS